MTAFARDRSSCGHRQVDIGSHSFTAAAWLLQQLWQCSNDARTVTILVSSCPLSHSLRHGHEQVQHAELIYTQVPLVYFLAGFARCFLSIFSIGVWDRRYSRAARSDMFPPAFRPCLCSSALRWSSPKASSSWADLYLFKSMGSHFTSCTHALHLSELCSTPYELEQS